MSKGFIEFRQSCNIRLKYLEKQSRDADRKAVKTGRVNDRIDAIEYRAQLTELERLIEGFNNIMRKIE